MTERAIIDVAGQVQGVGFRPFVYALARSLLVNGFVQNRGGGVLIDAEAEAETLRQFVDRLATDAPLPARVQRLHVQAVLPHGQRGFSILESAGSGAPGASITPDLATCADCLTELFDPRNRRYRHPFITCTACGPRYSVIIAPPYDRQRTTMAPFALCRRCRDEYQDPADRRFHAQAIACPECGPVLTLEAPEGGRHGDAALSEAVRIIARGGIVAIKGLGGFHLACDATDSVAVKALRQRKRRDAKPLAVMIPPGTVGALTRDPATRAALAGRIQSIVLIPRAQVSAAWRVALASEVAAGCPAVGVLLPYTPLHHLLLSDFGRPLVMTSLNIADEPTLCSDGDARGQLGRIADAVLSHDRRIHSRCDDSVVRVQAGETIVLRRGQGLAPSALALAETTEIPVLAVGAHLKNAACIVVRDRAYVSPHIGDLESVAAYEALRATVRHLASVLGVVPDIVAHDRHPDYLSTRFASELLARSRVAVQHHHAHVLSCVAEHGITDPVVGVAFDGAGLGDDGAVWGGEFLRVDGTESERLAHLAYVPLPGGDAAAREPWRMAVAHLAAAYGPDLGPFASVIRKRVPARRCDGVVQLVTRGAAAQTSSIGRLFDAVASLAGLRDTADFEGQAAMDLEARATGAPVRPYAFTINRQDTPWRVDAVPVVRAIVTDVLAGVAVEDVAASFHLAVAKMLAAVAVGLARRRGIRIVVLTGGVFQNALLSRLAAEQLADSGLQVLHHRQVPCGDGGLALGQALLAVRLARQEARAACA